MSDENEVDESSEELPGNAFLSKPVITAPTASVVSRRFNVHALTLSPLPHIKWNLDFYKVGQNNRLKRYDGGMGIAFIEFVVPDELPVGVDLYFKIQYRDSIPPLFLYSSWTTSRVFRIQALDRPTISNPAIVWIPRPTLSGRGVAGASVQLFEGGVGTIIFATTQVLSDGTWSVQLKEPLWMANPFNMTARQTLNGETSDWAVNVKFIVLFKPVISTVSVDAGGKPTISGYGGLSGARIEIWLSGGAGGAHLVGTVRQDGSWSMTATSAWAPNSYLITARQVAGGHESDWAGGKTFEVKPPLPMIWTPAEDGSNVGAGQLTGTCMAGAKMRAKFINGTPPEADVYVYGTSWAYNYAWAPGMHRFQMQQTVNGQASGWTAVRTFYIKPPVPAITEPAPKTSHLANVLVKGTRMAGATVVVQDIGSRPIVGTLSYSGNTWSFAYPWLPGAKHVKAVQTVNGQTSAATGVLEFTIKPPKPVIQLPPVPAAAKELLTITGVVSGAHLEMFTEAGVRIDGSFKTEGATSTFTHPGSWLLGTTRVKVTQTVNNVRSDDSALVAVSVKPPAPRITLPKEGESYVALQVQGTCEPGATVTVWSGGTDLGPVQVTGTSWTNDFTWQPGPKVVQARQAVAGQDSPDTGVINFKIKPSQPTISPPPDPAAADEALIITGVWEGAVNLAMFTEANIPVAGDFSDGGTSRTFTPLDDWAPGINTVKVVQTVNTVDSDPSDECTFSVEVGEKPEAPQFLLPMPGARTSTRPTVRVRGLAGAQQTVRLEEGATLHEHNADVDGILEFTVETPLTPGTNALQVRQKAGGPVSDWSETHRFTVKELPQKPIIEAPAEGSNASRTPTIRGTGETRGEIMLRHADSEKLIDTITGVKPWRWTAREPWPIGDYSVEVQQTDEGDSSGWSDARTFKVVESLYGIGDSTPVLANPVVGSGQSVKLRVQVLSGNSGEAAEGVAVQWRLNGQEDILDTTVTDSDGWAYYAYTPETVGKSEVVADITNDNDGVVMTQLYEVNARLHDDWAQQAQLTLGGQNVELDLHDLVLPAGKTRLLTLTFKDGNHLWGTYVTLQDMWGTAEGLTVVPPLGTPQKVEAPMLTWFISSAEGQSGIFGLRLTSPVLSDWQLPGRVITEDFVHTLDVELDTFPQVFGGEAVYPCLGARHTLTVRPKPDSPIIGLPVLPEFTPEAVDLGVTLRPLVQTMKESGVSWSLDCFTSSKSGNFAMRLALLGWFLKSGEMPMSLGHNKVEITERDGPSQIKERWRYGIRVTSAFSGQPAGDVAVTVSVSGSEDVQRSTQSDGWIYVYYDDGQVVSFTIHNGYDGTTVTG